MFSKILISLALLAATAVKAQGDELEVYNIKVTRLVDHEFEPWGCITVHAKGYPIVSSGSSGDQCTRFEVTNYSDTPDTEFTGRYRFKELSTHKLMNHDGHWIYFNGAPEDTSNATLFIEQQDYSIFSAMHPADTSTLVYADYDTGELNVKQGGQGFEVLFKLERYYY